MGFGRIIPYMKWKIIQPCSKPPTRNSYGVFPMMFWPKPYRFIPWRMIPQLISCRGETSPMMDTHSNGRSATFGDQTSRFAGMRKWWDTTSHNKTRSILLDSTWGYVRLRKWRITCHNHPHVLHGAGGFTNMSPKYHPNVAKCMEHMGSIP